MALNTVSSDRLSTNVKNTNFTAAEKQDLTDDIKPLLGSSGGGNKNLIINGAMQVAQRGTSATTNGYSTVDRFKTVHSGIDEGPTYAQVDVSSGTTPYTSGFRKALKITNGNQTSGAGAADFISYAYRIEAQDIANSGWNYVSSSSFVTLSFWIKSSVAQDFKGYIRAHDGTSQAYAFATGSLSADTWTKITKTISGNSNLTFDNNSDVGFELVLGGFWGTDYTNNSVTEDAWAAYASGTRMKDNTSTWYTTNDATLEITGLQLEVGSVATDFEHRSFAQELALCQRYFQRFATGDGTNIGIGFYYTSTQLIMVLDYIVQMRTTPTFSMISGTHYYVIYANGVADTFNSFTISSGVGSDLRCEIYNNSEISGTSGSAGVVRCNNAAPNGGQIDLSAEL